jgi:hypothetical protein
MGVPGDVFRGGLEEEFGEGSPGKKGPSSPPGVAEHATEWELVMAERSVRPVALASRWRSRPGVVRVAAVLLGLFGLLLALVEADQVDLDAAELVTALVLVSTAAALVWAGRLGSWVGLTVAALIAVVLLARRPGVAGLVVTAICVLPLVLLVLPAARRPQVASRPARSSAVLKQPQGWTRPIAGWGQVAFLVVGGC